MKSAVVILRKEKGMTSFAAVSRLRRLFGEKKAGHTGTLDPDAEGVLIVCLGKATKLVPYLSDHEKTYETELLLGTTTDTEDISGTVLAERPVNCTAAEVQEAILSFAGRQMQIPPMYSAKKVDGRRLYELARRGEEIARRAQEVFFSDFRIEEIALPVVRFSVHCSKGAYIRTLCKDIGEKLGCGACMQRLLRTEVGGFALAESHTLAEIESLLQQGKEAEILLPIDRFFETLPAYTANENTARAIRNGNTLALAQCGLALQDGESVRVYLPSGQFAAVYECRGGTLYAARMFLE